MKKIIYLTMIIISLAMCLCGCTKKNQEGQLSKIYKVPQKLIYINAPSTYEETQNGDGEDQKIHNSVERKRCQGFGNRKGKCRNSVATGNELCKECRVLEYYEKIENLYKIQNYFITEEKEYFCAEQKSGIIKSSALVFPLYSEEVEITKNIGKRTISSTLTNICRSHG